MRDYASFSPINHPVTTFSLPDLPSYEQGLASGTSADDAPQIDLPRYDDVFAGQGLHRSMTVTSSAHELMSEPPPDYEK